MLCQRPDKTLILLQQKETAKLMKIFKRKQKDIIRVKTRSNIIQYDSMGYPLRLCIMSNNEQMWIDTHQKEDDIVIIWH